MSEHEDTARAVRDALTAHNLEPTEEELGIYVAVAPMLHAMTEQLFAVETGDEL